MSVSMVWGSVSEFMAKRYVSVIEPSARPTTKSPVTAPPLNERSSAGPVPSCAAWATREFVRTAMCMPTIPAKAEAAAPIIKPMPTCTPSAQAIKANNTTAIAATTLYWRLRYATAPSWIASAISIILGFPRGCLIIPLIKKRLYKIDNPAVAKTI